MKRHAAGSALLLISVLVMPSGARAYVLGDDFQVYTATGSPSQTSFPHPWLDAGEFNNPTPAPTSPSAWVANSPGAQGTQTKVLKIREQVALVSGIYQEVPISGRYRIVGDVFIDRYSNVPLDAEDDFPVHLAFVELNGSNLYVAPAFGPYASSRTGRWRLFLKPTGPQQPLDLDLGINAEVGRWYRLEFEINAATGAYHTSIQDLSTGETPSCPICDGVFPSWTSGSGAFNGVALIEGEHDSRVTVANRAWFDNVMVETFPAPVSSGGGGGCGMGPELAILVPLLIGARRARSAFSGRR